MNVWTILVPMAGAVVAFLGGRRLGPFVGVAVAAGNLVVAARLAMQVWTEGPQRMAVGGWGAPLGIDLVADGLSAIMLLLIAVVGAGITVYSVADLKVEKTAAGRGGGEELYWPLWLVLWASLNALFLSGDVFNLYVLLEVVGLSAVALAALAGKPEALVAALRYLLAAMVGSLFYLAGVALLYAGHHTLDLALLGASVGHAPADRMAVAFMVLGLLLKTALFPLHFWLPSAHSTAMAPVSAVLSALVVKGSFYLLVRLWVSVFNVTVTVALAQGLGALGALAILWGSIQAMRQQRLKLLVAHSTVAQIGYLFLIFPLITLGAGESRAAAWLPMAWTGTFFQALAHALAKASMFLCAGVVMLAHGSDRLMALHGTAGRLPMTTFALGISGIALIGLPPSGGFVAKWLLLKAAIESGQWWWAPVLVIGGLLTAAYVFIMLAGAFRPRAEKPTLHAVPKWMELSALALALAALAVGFRAEEFLRLLSIGMPFRDEVNWEVMAP